MDPAGLINFSDDALVQLGEAGAAGPATSDLALKLARFRILSRGLTDHIAEMSLCANVKDSLREWDAWPHETAEDLSDWSQIKASLTEIARRRKDDQRAARTLTAAERFEAAGADRWRSTMQFQRLQHWLRDLEITLGKSLLSEIRSMLKSTRVLDETLRAI
jgi:hypothetical protein